MGSRCSCSRLMANRVEDLEWPVSHTWGWQAARQVRVRVPVFSSMGLPQQTCSGVFACRQQPEGESRAYLTPSFPLHPIGQSNAPAQPRPERMEKIHALS